MRRRALVLSAVLAVSLTAGACGSDSGKEEADTTTTARERTTTTVAAAAAALEAKLIKNVPAGYVVEDDDVGDTGPSDLDKAASDDGGDDAREVLIRDGFVAGYQRYWAKDDENFIVGFLYEFSKAAGATDYAERGLAVLLEPEEGVTTTQFAVSGIPGAKGVHLKGPDGQTAIVVFTRGGFMAQVVVSGVDATQATAGSLATQQYGNLA